MPTVAIGIAGITIAFEGALPLQDQFRSYKATSEDPDVQITRSPDKISSLNLQNYTRVFDSESAWRLYRGDESWIVVLGNPEPYQIIVFNDDYSQGVIHTVSPDSIVNPVETPFFPLYLVNLLAHRDGLLLHASGVDYQGSGYIFAGKSGVGKTTMARLWEAGGAKILSDEGVIIRVVEGQLWLYGTPLQSEGGASAQGRVPLKGIYFLHHAAENTVMLVASVAASAKLIACGYPPMWHAKSMQRTLQLCENIVNHIPCYNLGFVPDRNVLNFIAGIEVEIGANKATKTTIS